MYYYIISWYRIADKSAQNLFDVYDEPGPSKNYTHYTYITKDTILKVVRIFVLICLSIFKDNILSLKAAQLREKQLSTEADVEALKTKYAEASKEIQLARELG